MWMWGISYLAIIVVVGYASASTALGGCRRNAAELAGLVIGLGAGNMGLLLFFMSLAGWRPTRAIVLGIAVAAVAALGLLWRRGRLTSPSPPTPWTCTDLWIIVPAVLVPYALYVVAWHALALPLFEWDAFAIWGLKAKVLTFEALRPGPAYFHDLSL